MEYLHHESVVNYPMYDYPYEYPLYNDNDTTLKECDWRQYKVPEEEKCARQFLLQEMIDVGEYTTLTDNFLKVQIFFETMNTEEIKEMPATGDFEFFSEIGGLSSISTFLTLFIFKVNLFFIH